MREPVNFCGLTTLRVLNSGSKCRVEAVATTNRSLCNKLLSMGIVAGTIIEVLSVAPLGDPMKIKARGYHLSLRLSEAETVRVTPL